MSVYILHFSDAVGGRARHYVGFANNVDGRLRHHQNGSGARLTQVAAERGIEMSLARTFEGADRAFERRLKNTKNTARYCPICSGKHARDYHPREG